MTDRPNLPRKRLYVFDTEDDGFDDGCRFTVVHTSLREAKKWLWNDCDVRAYCDEQYILFNPFWLKDVDVSGMSIGDSLDGIIGVKMGVYSWVDDTCPECGKTGKIEQYDDWDKICCSDCEDKLYEAWKLAQEDPRYHSDSDEMIGAKTAEELEGGAE